MITRFAMIVLAIMLAFDLKIMWASRMASEPKMKNAATFAFFLEVVKVVAACIVIKQALNHV